MPILNQIFGRFGQPAQQPSLPPPTNQNLVEVAERLKELAEIWQGARGDGLDRVLTIRDLLNINVVDPESAAAIYTASGQHIPTTMPTAPSDPATPPTPTNLFAIGGVGTIIVSWDFPIEYTRLANFELWRSETDALGDAVLIASPFANVYADEVDVAATYYYWVRAVSDAGVSPFNAVAGTLGETAPAFEDIDAGTSGGEAYPAGIYLRDIYVRNGSIVSAKIGNAEITTAKIRDLHVTTAKIDDLAVNEAKIANLAVTNAKIADLAVTNAKINDLSADKITAGFLAAARIAAGSIDATKLAVLQLSAITADMGEVTAGVIRNVTDSVHIDMNATGGSLLLRAGPSTYYGPYAGTHYPVEIYADGNAFLGRGVVAGGSLKASGSYAIPNKERPAVIFETTPTIESGGD